MKNLEIANIFYEMADILEIQGVDFKPRAYRRAARSIENLDKDIEYFYNNNSLEEIPGVGKNIADKIKEYIETGKIKEYEKIKKKFPKGFSELLDIRGLGPKLVHRLNKEIGIRNLNDLKKALDKHKIAELEGFGEKSEEKIRKSLENVKSKRILLGVALPTAKKYLESIRKNKYVEKADLAGSIARKKETIGDIDIVVLSKDNKKVMDYFTEMDDVKRTINKGDTKSSVLLENNIQIDLRVVPKKSYGAALQYFIGSKEHNIQLRKIAIKKGYKLNEYGLFKGNKKVAGEKQKDIYSKLGLEMMPPEMRENRGEIELAKKHKIPKLIGYNDIKGDMHIHTNHSDGVNTIEEVIKQAEKMGYKYIGISDHVLGPSIAKHVKNIDSYIKKIDKARKKANIDVFIGAEVDIKKDGSLRCSDDQLKKFDYIIASIHSGFESSGTERILKAVENRYVHIIGHPFGRKIQQRPEIDIDHEKLFDSCNKNGKLLEINSSPERLDLSDINIKSAIDHKVKMVINTDSHTIDSMKNIELGIATARRGWAKKSDIINTKKSLRFN